MPSNFAKPIWDLGDVKYLNAGNGDSVLGGQVQSVPTNVPASQGRSNRPGDRIILGHADALALSDTTNVGTLYGGMYQYVQTYASATATYVRGKMVFRYTTAGTSAEDQLYKVTSDEAMGQGANLRSGWLLQTITAGYYCWIQVAGKVTAWFKASITGTPADGCGVYAAAAGAGADVGKVDVLTGADMGATTSVYYGIVDNMIKRYAGIALGAPSNNNLCLVDVPIRHLSF